MNKNAIQQPEQHTEQQPVSDRLVRLLPYVVGMWLLLIVLMAGVAVWERNFLQKAAPGTYWLFVAYGKIAVLFTYLFYPTAFLVCLLLIAPPHVAGIFGYFKNKPMWARHRPPNSRLLVIGRIMSSVFVCTGSMWLGISPFNHIDRHVDTVGAHGSIYHLAYSNGELSEAGSSSHYVLAKCDQSGIVCRQIDSVPTSYWIFPEVEEMTSLLDYSPSTDEIQIIEEGVTVYTYHP